MEGVSHGSGSVYRLSWGSSFLTKCTTSHLPQRISSLFGLSLNPRHNFWFGLFNCLLLGFFFSSDASGEATLKKKKKKAKLCQSRALIYLQPAATFHSVWRGVDIQMSRQSPSRRSRWVGGVWFNPWLQRPARPDEFVQIKYCPCRNWWVKAIHHPHLQQMKPLQKRFTLRWTAQWTRPQKKKYLGVGKKKRIAHHFGFKTSRSDFKKLVFQLP